MDITIFTKKIDTYNVWKGFGVFVTGTNKEYYITKTNEISELISKQELLGSSFNNYNREYATSYSVNLLKKDLFLKYYLINYLFGETKKYFFKITFNENQNIQIIHKPTDITLYTGKGACEKDFDFIEVKILSRKETKYNGKFLR